MTIESDNPSAEPVRPLEYGPSPAHGVLTLPWIVRFRMPVVLFALVVAATILTDGVFARPDNLVNVARQIAPEAIIAFGMTLIIVTGGIDLSVGSMVALTGIVAGIAMRETAGTAPAVRVVFGLVAGMGVGAVFGSFSGGVVTRFSIPPFITTLAAMLIARGLAFILCGGQPIPASDLPAPLIHLGRGFVFREGLGRLLPVPVLMMLVAFVLFHVLLSRTVFGRGVIAVGSNEEAARLSGIAVRRTKLLVYALTGALCGVVGVIQDGKFMAADPKVAEMWELNVIAAVVVGGTSLFGGRGSIPGTLVGALIIGVMNNSLNLLHVEHFWQKVVLGSVILGASLLDAALYRLGGRRII